MYRSYKIQQQNITRFEDLKDNIYSELNLNNRIFRSSILGSWNRLYDQFSENYENTITFLKIESYFRDDFTRFKEYLSFFNDNYANFTKLNSNIQFPNTFLPTVVPIAYKQQSMLKKSYTECLNTYNKLATDFIEGTQIGNDHPQYKEFSRKMNEVNHYMANMPQVYASALTSLNNKRFNEEKLDQIDTCTSFGMMDLLENYCCKLNMVHLQNEKDSMAQTIKDVLDVYFDDFNEDLLARYKKEPNVTKEKIEQWMYYNSINLRHNRIITEKRGNKILVMAQIPGLEYSSGTTRLEVLEIIENTLNKAEAERDMEHFIGIFFSNFCYLGMASTPFQKEITGYIKDKQILCEFFTTPKH